jgi:hypothetical protein
MLVIVSSVSNERASYIFKHMPLKMAFAYEHFYFIQNGYECKVLSFEQSLEDLMRDI